MSAGPAIAALTEAAELRTWSLIVTIFGDMARAPGAEIPGPVLSALTTRMGVKPEAMRVALHRLRKDGWIEARRAGRVSHYFLTPQGRAQSEAATARIFARNPQAPDIWHMAIAGPLAPPDRQALDETMAASGHVALCPGAWIGPGPTPEDTPKGLLTFDGHPSRLPAWVRDAVGPATLCAAYERFEAALATASEAVPASARLPLLDRAALRILVVHGWRRLVLRHPDLPDAFFPPGWPGGRVRPQVHALLDRIGATCVADLAETAPL